MFRERPLNLNTPRLIPRRGPFDPVCSIASQIECHVVPVVFRVGWSFSRCTIASPTKASPSTTSCSSLAIPICFPTRLIPGRN